MEKVIKLEIRAKLVKYTDKNGEEKEFLSYKGLTKKGWYDLRFTKEVNPEKLPQASGTIYVSKENININTASKYPTIWVKDVEKFEEIKFEQKLENYFEEI